MVGPRTLLRLAPRELLSRVGAHASERLPLALDAAANYLTVGRWMHVHDIATDGDVEHADGDVDAATARGIGIAVESYDGETSVTAGNPVSGCVFGPVSGLSGMTPGANHYVSDDVGRLADAAGTFSLIMGYAERAGGFFVHPEQNDPAS